VGLAAEPEEAGMTKRSFALVMVAIAIALLIRPVNSKEAVVESLWAAKPLVIDGAATDWDDATPITDKNSNAQYALKNDGKNLYLIMVMRDDNTRSTVGYTGIKVFVSSGAKKSKDEGFLFHQKQMTPDELIASLEAKGEVLSEDRKAELRKQKSYVAYLEDPLVPKKDAAAAATAAGKPEAPMFRSLVQGKISIYEFRIPLSLIGAEGGVQPGSEIKVGFEWGGVTKEIMKNIMADRASSGATARASAGSSDSGFSDSSGDGGGGGGDFAPYMRDPRYKKRAFWIDAKLAAQ
jgi:hypothetical protein